MTQSFSNYNEMSKWDPPLASGDHERMRSERFQRNRDIMKKKKGFTLIEIVVVVAIITIIAAILLPNFVRGILEAQLGNCVENERILAGGLELYKNDDPGGSYPNNLGILVTNGYVAKKLTCLTDPTKSNYSYQVNMGVQGYTIQCVGNHTQMQIPLTYPHYTSTGGLQQKP